MIRFRILALLTVVGSVLLFRWAWFAPTPENFAPPQFQFWLRFVFFLLSPYMVLSGTMLFILALMAIRPTNGEYVIKRSSIYGKVFRYFAAGEKHKRGYCAAFWRTNGILFGLTLLAAFIFTLAMTLYEKWKELLFAIGIIVTVAGAILLWIRFTDAFSKAVPTAKRVLIALFALAAVVTYWYFTSTYFTSTPLTLMTLAGISIVSGVIYAIVRIVRWSRSRQRRPRRIRSSGVRLPSFSVKMPRWGWMKAFAESNFGLSLQQFYRSTLCPRIRLE